MNFIDYISRIVQDMRADMVRPSPARSATAGVSRELIWDLEEEVSRLESGRNRSASPAEREIYDDHIGALMSVLDRHAPPEPPAEEPRP